MVILCDALSCTARAWGAALHQHQIKMLQCLCAQKQLHILRCTGIISPAVVLSPNVCRKNIYTSKLNSTISSVCVCVCVCYTLSFVVA